MTLRTPPSWEQNASHPAENDRLTTQALWKTTGIIGASSMAVTANSPAGMSVRVASGWAAIVGTTQANMGTYVAYNDATVTLTITSANPSNPRIDLICATINDSYYSGATDNVVFQVVAGTPAGSPVAPATPANSIALATVAVAAATTVINTGDITDQRVEVTTNIPVAGDITAVYAGTGLTGGGTSGDVTLSIGTSVVTLTGSQALTNKDLTSGTNSFPTSLVTLTGSQALTNKDLTSGTNSFPTSLVTLSGSQTLTNKTLTTPAITRGDFTSPLEITTVSATAATGTINFDAMTQGILYYTSNASNNFTLNFRGDSGTALNSIMANGDSISLVFMATNGASNAYYLTGITIDGSAVTAKWTNGNAPSSGNLSAIDSYSFTIFKTASNTYTVIAGGPVKFA